MFMCVFGACMLHRTLPAMFSIHEGLPSNIVPTAFLSMFIIHSHVATAGASNCIGALAIPPVFLPIHALVQVAFARARGCQQVGRSLAHKTGCLLFSLQYVHSPQSRDIHRRPFQARLYTIYLHGPFGKGCGS